MYCGFNKSGSQEQNIGSRSVQQYRDFIHVISHRVKQSLSLGTGCYDVDIKSV